MRTIERLARWCSLLLVLGAAAAHAEEKFIFLTNWYAQAEHGGFYQAQAEGIYKKRGLDAIKNMIYRQVAEYFNKWRGVQQHAAIKIDQNMKGMIIRRWQQQLREAFDLWKRGKAHKEITMQNLTVMEKQEEGNNMQAAVDELNREIEIKEKQVVRSGKSALSRGTKIMKKRYLKQYLDKWA